MRNASNVVCWSLLSCALAPAWGDTWQTSVTPAQWQHHQDTLQFLGTTSKFSCDGLEQSVRQLLKYWGARGDLKVNARGCPGGPNHPSDSAWVDIDFYSLAPTSDASVTTVAAHWQPMIIEPHRPAWLDYGECELVSQLKKIVTSDFAVRAVDYRADCFPHEMTIADYTVKAEVLRPQG